MDCRSVCFVLCRREGCFRTAWCRLVIAFCPCLSPAWWPGGSAMDFPVVFSPGSAWRLAGVVIDCPSAFADPCCFVVCFHILQFRLEMIPCPALLPFWAPGRSAAGLPAAPPAVLAASFFRADASPVVDGACYRLVPLDILVVCAIPLPHWDSVVPCPFCRSLDFFA